MAAQFRNLSIGNDSLRRQTPNRLMIVQTNAMTQRDAFKNPTRFHGLQALHALNSYALSN